MQLPRNTSFVGKVPPEGYIHEQFPNHDARRRMQSKVASKGEFGSRRIYYRVEGNYEDGFKRIKCNEKEATHYKHPCKNRSGIL